MVSCQSRAARLETEARGRGHRSELPSSDPPRTGCVTLAKLRNLDLGIRRSN